MKNLIKLFSKLYILIIIFYYNVNAQCDPQLEYQSHYFHGSPYVFTPANTNKIEDSEGNFYEILFFENTLIKDNITFNSEQRSIYNTSGVLISKFKENGTKLYSKLSELNQTNIPTTGGLRGGTNYITLYDDTLVMFSLLKKGNYQTNIGVINIPFDILAKVNFNINDGALINIQPLISSENSDFRVSSMFLDGQDIYFSFVPRDSNFILLNDQKITNDPTHLNLFAGSYSISSNDIQINKIFVSKKSFLPRELTLKSNALYLTGIYTDTVYLENGDILYPKFTDPKIEIARDGYIVQIAKDLNILDYRTIRGLGDVENIQIKNSSSENFFLFLRTTSQNVDFEKNSVDTSIESKTYNLILMNSSLKLINAIPIENNDLNPDDFVQAEMIQSQKNEFVLSIATNGKNIIIGKDTLNTIKNSSNNGVTQYHIYFNSEGKRLKHQVYYGEGFFHLSPIITDDNFTYIQGSTTTDISGSYEIKMPNDAPLGFMTFYEKICTNKLLHTPKIEKLNSFNIYPNPTQTAITVECEAIISSIQIVDLMGKVVYQNNSVNETNFSMNISHFQNGLYLIKYFSEGKWNFGKMVKN
jgi:hypothetical protein